MDIQNHANEKNITLIRVYSLAEITIRELIAVRNVIPDSDKIVDLLHSKFQETQNP